MASVILSIVFWKMTKIVKSFKDLATVIF